MDSKGKLYDDLVELLNQLNANNSLRQYKNLVNEYNTQKSQIENSYEPMRMQAENDYSLQKNNIKAQYGQIINQAQHYVNQAKIADEQEIRRFKALGKSTDPGYAYLRPTYQALDKAEEQLRNAEYEQDRALRDLNRIHKDRINSIEKSCNDEILKIWSKFRVRLQPIFQENKSEIVNGFENIFNSLSRMMNPFDKVNKYLEVITKTIDTALTYHLISLTDISDIIKNTNISDDLKYIEKKYTEPYNKNKKLYDELVASVGKLGDKKYILRDVSSDIKKELDLLDKYLEINFDDINKSSKNIYNNTGIFKQLIKDKKAKLDKLENIVNNYNLVQENKDLIDEIVSIYEQIFKTFKEVQEYPTLNYNKVMANDSLDSNLRNIIKDTFNVININELYSFFDGNKYYTKDAENNYSSLISNNNTMNENIHKVKDFIKSFNDNFDLFSEKVKSKSKEKFLKYSLASGFIVVLIIVSSFLYIKNLEQQRLQTVSGYGYAIEYIKDPSEAVQLAAVKQNGAAIQYIENPSEAVQMAAVKQNLGAVQYIKNPSEAISSVVEAEYLERVKKRSSDIEYIKDPSEAVQMAAVKQKGYAIKYIKDPSEAVQMAAVKEGWNAITYIKNPSEAVQMAAVKQYGGAVQYIKNPSEALQMAAVRERGEAIQYIKDPSEAVQMAAVKQKYAAGGFKYIKNPSEAIQLAAVKQYGNAITYIKNPSEAVQMAAVKQDPGAVKYIKNPSEAVQWATVKQDPSEIPYIKNPTKAVKAYACSRRTIVYTDQQGRPLGSCPK